MSGEDFCKADIIKLVVIVLLFLVYNGAFFALSYPESGLAYDSASYIKPAEMLVSGLGYESRLRLPGYPLVIAAAMAITKDYQVAVIVIQVGLVLWAGIFTVMIGRYLLKKTSWLLLILVLFNNAITIYSHMILPDVLFMQLFLGYFLFLIKTLKDKSLFNAVWCGVFGGLMTLTRGNGFYLSLCTPALIMLCEIGEFKNIGLKRVLLRPVVFILVFAAVISPWVMFNYNTKGTLSVNTREYIDLSIIQTLAGVDRLAKRATFDEAFESVKEKAAKIKASQTESQGETDSADGHFVVTHAREIFFMHPKKDIAKAILAATGSFYFDPAYKPFTNHLKIESLQLDNSLFGGRWSVGGFFKALFSFSSLPLILDAALIGLIVLLRIFGLVGLFACFKGKDRQVLICVVAAILYFTITTGLVAYARYRLAIEPILLMLAVMGAGYCKRIIKGYNN